MDKQKKRGRVPIGENAPGSKAPGLFPGQRFNIGKATRRIIAASLLLKAANEEYQKKKKLNITRKKEKGRRSEKQRINYRKGRR